jgi:hypothetical protein
VSGWRASIVAAIVGGIVLLAGWLLSQSGDGDGNGPGTTSSGELADLACPAALEAVCADLAVELGVEVRSFAPGDDPGEGVVVIAPAADLPATLDSGPVVGTSPIVITVWRERSLVLGAECEAIDVTCLTTVLGRTWADLGGNSAWGDVKLGLADPGRSEVGLAAWGLLAADGVPPGLESSLRMRADDAGSLMVEIAQFGDSRADIAVTTEVAVAAQLRNVIGRGGRLEVHYPDPAPWIDFVAAGTGREADATIARLLESDLQARLAPVGLRPATGSSAELPDGLGEAGSEAAPYDEATRAALLEAWEDLR